ncbi:valine--tRNA ligase [Anaeramoeba flamelloides]|uniref:Valine--tRNA ligase, mitochondrial n=1 Tax=Anaeramoeba flamelloides TaxID=1746091 RepID=A0AAV7Y6X0_9EUKA|nr:valine--tRNA ligase [Anaeramoeba flamelloides]
MTDNKTETKKKKEIEHKDIKGKKKDLSSPMQKSYDPIQVEAQWYEYWEKQGYFKPNEGRTGKKFVIALPPPNVTGSLHLGHALTGAIQDSLVRWHRMKGDETLYLPALDHAGIATQSVVEKKLLREKNLTRQELGRENFVEEIWKWKKKYGGRINKQLRRLGSSLDWARATFTMDKKINYAVNEAFIRLHNEGIIYRSTRLVNWSCRLKTVISDIEVEYKDIKGKTYFNIPGYGNKKYRFGVLTEFAYPMKDETLEPIVVATTRIETMLGDTAIAVHSKDERYLKYHEKYAIHPFSKRMIPIICDDILVDPNFGTGAVKVTPGHDPNDYAAGKRHNLEIINILNEDGTINANGGRFENLKRFDARIEVAKQLEERGLLKGETDNSMRIAFCTRSGDIIEPIVKPQWFVNCGEMAKSAMKAVEEGELKIYPENNKQVWFNWLNNIRDWCVSRQLWWGHRIPAYFVVLEAHDRNKTEHWVSAHTEEEAKKIASKKFEIEIEKVVLERDPDVLDTWFSSGLFPFSILGWPNEESLDLLKYYPTSLLETGKDILFFWVARMVMLGLKLTGKLPFSEVYLHSIVRDSHRRKMSKSLGNVVDPLSVITGITLEGLHKTLYTGNLSESEVKLAIKSQKKDFPKGIPQCGCDALRFGLCDYTPHSKDINLNITKIVTCRQFCNKIWNATRFTLMNLGKDFVPVETESNFEELNWHVEGSFLDRCILSKINKAIIICNKSFEKYSLSGVTECCHNFWLHDFCDIYLESVKNIMKIKEDDFENTKIGKENCNKILKQHTISKNILFRCLDFGLKLLHPIMPFVTEELWQRIPKLKKSKPSIMIEDYPEPIPIWDNSKDESLLKTIKQIIHSVRSTRQQYSLTKMKPRIYLSFPKISEILYLLQTDKQTENLILFLGKVSSIEYIEQNNKNKPNGCIVDIISDACIIYVLLQGLIDIPLEIKKLKKKKKQAQRSLKKLMIRTKSINYEFKVPLNIQKKNFEIIQGLNKKIKDFDFALKNLNDLLNEKN